MFGSSLAVVSPGNRASAAACWLGAAMTRLPAGLRPDEIEGNVDSTRMSWPTPTSSFFSFASGDYEYQSVRG